MRLVRRSPRCQSVLGLILALVMPLACGRGSGADAGTSHGPATRIAITSTGDALADAATYLKLLCPKPIGGELNVMVWEG